MERAHRIQERISRSMMIVFAGLMLLVPVSQKGGIVEFGGYWTNPQAGRIHSLHPPFSVREFLDERPCWFILDDRFDRHHLWVSDGWDWTCHKLTTFQTWDMERWIERSGIEPYEGHITRPMGLYDMPVYYLR